MLSYMHVSLSTCVYLYICICNAQNSPSQAIEACEL